MLFDLKKLLSPKSIAVVGASPREGVAAMVVIKNLRTFGFPGPIYPVNPRYPEIRGERCFPSLTELPETPDAVFVAVGADHVVPIIEEAGRCGIRGAVVNASGFSDSGTDGETLQRRLLEAAQAGNVAVCGPNNMGFINVNDHTCLYTASRLPRLDAGPVAVISQSGSVAIAISQDSRRLGLSYVITAGNEAVCTAADYLRAVVDDDRVGIVLMFLETVRNPKLFAEVAERAAERGKRIIVVKVGRSEGARAAVAAHTGALSGEDAVYDAFFRRLGIVRAADIDEMIETAILFLKYPTPPQTRRSIVITVSGGEAALVTDLGADVGLNFPELSPETLAAMKPFFPAFSRPRNPVDIWGLGWDASRFKQILNTLVTEPAAGVIALAVDAPDGNSADAHVVGGMAEICIETAPNHDKKILFFNNTAPGDVNGKVHRMLDPHGIPYLLGMRPALAALANWLNFNPPARLPARERLGLPPLHDLGELDRLSLVAKAGIPFVESVVARDAADAARIAEQFGFPVVMKGVSTRLPHKTELGLVRLSLSDAAAVQAAFKQLAGVLGQHAAGDEKAAVVVQPMLEEGIQLLLGVRNDPQFGSIVVVGLGGTLVEVMKETSLRIGPVDAATAKDMLSETRAATLIAGTRGKGPFDLDAAVEAILALSRFAQATADTIATIEINPLIVRKKGRGAFGVDLVLEGFQS
jgi:acyl-CoA synthetase (NDP forming)